LCLPRDLGTVSLGAVRVRTELQFQEEEEEDDMMMMIMKKKTNYRENGRISLNLGSRTLSTISSRSTFLIFSETFLATSATSSETFTAVMLQVEVFWVVTQCSVVVGKQRFGGPCCFHLEGEVDAARSSETLVTFRITTQRHNP
jgi:hypothetical protein